MLHKVRVTARMHKMQYISVMIIANIHNIGSSVASKACVEGIVLLLKVLDLAVFCLEPHCSYVRLLKGFGPSG